jgi:6-pyruvoyltetrahydropterin/6-carboxytetrahydropterin synthase
VFGEEAGRRQFGHNYVLEVALCGPLDPETGMVMDLKRLKEILEREVADRFDHANLNEDTEYFRERAPVPEAFAQLLFELLDAAIPGELLHSVRLSPTTELTVEVTR